MELKQIIDNRLMELYQNVVPEEVKKRIKEELNMIENNKIEYQYLLVYQISEKAKSDGKIMIDRVCGSSFIAYILGITFVNPIDYYITYESEFKPITFDLEFADDYFPVILDYIKEICKNKGIKIDKVEDLKKHNIYLNTFSTAYLLEQLEEKTNKRREDIDINDSIIYAHLMNRDTSLLENFEMELVEYMQSKYLQSIKCIIHLAIVLSLSHSTISDKLEIINPIMYYPIFREDIYDFLKLCGVERELAYEIMNFIAKGNHHNHKEKWDYYISIMKEHEVDDKYIDYCFKIHYLYPKSYSVNRAILYAWLTYYKIYYPEIFDKLAQEKEGI